MNATFTRRVSTKRAALAILGAIVIGGAAAVAGGAGAATAAADQTITVTVHAPSVRAYSDAFTVAASSDSGLPVSFSASGACSNAGATFTITSGTGTCLVKYDQPGSAAYNPAPQVVESVTAQKADQAIAFGPIEDATFGDVDYDIGGALSTSGLAVTLTASGKCTISGSIVQLTGAGSCTVTASQPGDANYNVAPPVSQTFAIAKADQEITFEPVEDKAQGDPDFTVKATADSGLPVSFAANGSCTVRGARVHLTGRGTCTLTASQPGNADYKAAPDVSERFAITAPNCSVPKVVGKRLRAAKLALVRSHCRTGKVTYARSRRTPKGRVSSQSRRPGRTLPANARIDLVVSRGRP